MGNLASVSQRERPHFASIRFLVGVAAVALVAACTSGGTSSPSTASSLSPSGPSEMGSPSGGAALPAEYRIGVNVGLSSWLAPYDTPALDGFRLAVDEINAAGGIGGKSKIVLTVKDNRSDSAEAAKISSEFVEEGVDFIILPGDASMAIPAGQVAQQAGIPMMSFLASTSTQRDAVGDFFFSNGQTDTLSGAGAAKYAVEAGYSKAYTLTSPDSTWLFLYPEYFAESFAKLGGTLVGTDEFRVGNQDFSAQIAKIKDLDNPPDVLFTSMYEPEWPAFIRQLRAAGVEIPVIASDAIDTEATLSLGETVDGTVAITQGYPVPGDRLDQFYTRYEEATGERPAAVFPAVGYDTAKVIENAVVTAGTTDRIAVRDGIEATTTFEGVLGLYEFGIIPGFPVRPLTVQRWVADDSGNVSIEKVTEVIVEPGEIPNPREG